MTGTYKVISLNGAPSPWTTQQGKDMLGYWMKLEGVNDDVNWNRAADAEAPKAGQEYELTLEPKKTSGGKDFFKATLSQNKGYRNSGGGGGSRDLSPEAQARIDASGRAQGRAHAQEMALRLADLQIKTGQKKVIDGVGLVPLIDWFYSDAQAAKAADYEAKR
jgi:hypothetical protein